MKQVTYLLREPYGQTRARFTLPEAEPVTLEPWMQHGIANMGWRLEAVETVETGIETHGWVDWKQVADSLAVILREMITDVEPPEEEELQDLLARAQSALDDYHVAEMEVSVATPDQPEGTPGDSEADDGE